MIKKNFLVNLIKRSITYIYLSNKKVDQHQCVLKVLATYRSTKGRIAIAHNYAWNIIQWYLDITKGQGTEQKCVRYNEVSLYRGPFLFYYYWNEGYLSLLKTESLDNAILEF